MVAAGEYLNFLSIDKWTIIFNLLNTLILYKIVKKFLFKPVNKIINDRKKDIENDYTLVKNAKVDAEKFKNEYANKLDNINFEATEILKVANIQAERQSCIVIDDAKKKAENIIKKANNDIKLERKKAINEMKDDVADIAFLAASSIIKKEVEMKNHKQLIDDFFNEVNK